jgi:branched-chain amino acid transport system substrate-binding protein
MQLVFLFFLLSLPTILFSETRSSDPAAIKIGASLALSGKLSFIGVAQQQGLELAIEDINSLEGINGKPLQLLIEDNAGDPKNALDGLNKLINLNKVDFIFSALSHVTQAIKYKVQQSGKLMIYAASLGDIAKDNELFFRDWGDAESQGATLARAVSLSKYRKVVFLTEISEGCLSIQQSFEKEAEKYSLNIIADYSYAPGETDFRSILLKIAQSKAEAIVTCTWRDSFMIMPQLKQLGMINLPTFQYLAPILPASDTAEMRALYQENKSVAVWLAFIEGNMSQQQKSFFHRIKSKYGSSARMESALAYDDMIILAAAMRQCTDPQDLQCVSKALLKTNYTGVAGPISFDSFGRSNRPDLLISVQDGIWAQHQ